MIDECVIGKALATVYFFVGFDVGLEGGRSKICICYSITFS